MTVIRNWKKALITDLNNIAVELKEAVEHPAVIILDGPVGAGKTTFTRVLLEEKKEAPSPTYSIINEIDNYLHADFYRIEDKNELIHLEIPMYLEDKDFFIIEWGLPFVREIKKIVGDEFHYYQLTIEINDNQSRNFILSKLD